jgi:hypothetical protein
MIVKGEPGVLTPSYPETRICAEMPDDASPKEIAEVQFWLDEVQRRVARDRIEMDPAYYLGLCQEVE